MPPLDLLKVPRDQEPPRRCDNTSLRAGVASVELGRGEIHALDLVLDYVLGVKLQLDGLRLGFGDGLVKAGDSRIVFSGQK